MTLSYEVRMMLIRQSCGRMRGNIAIFAMAVLTICALVSKGAIAQPRTPWVEGEVLVEFAPYVTPARARVIARRIGATLKRHYAYVNIYSIRGRRGATTMALLQRLKRIPQVRRAMPNYIVHALQPPTRFPNDQYFNVQWGLHNMGQNGGKIDADIDAPEAWSITTGSNNVVVAVIDSGVDYTHPDLRDNMWRNPDEIPGNGLDDDGNGYVDDIYGIDAYMHQDNDGDGFPDDPNDNDPMDENGHGTHCAGIIGAVGDNGVGICGVNWNVQIMALRFLGPDGSGSIEGAIECLDYITMMRQSRNINIVASNNSWGMLVSRPWPWIPYWQWLYFPWAWGCDPAWSQDGQWIAFREQWGRWMRIARKSVDGNNYQPLTGWSGNPRQPTWEPILNNPRIAYISDQNDERPEIYWLYPGGSSFRVTNIVGEKRDPFWASDGYIYFAMKVPGKPDFDIYRIRPNGTGLQQVTSNPGNDTNPTVSSINGWLLFVSDRATSRDPNGKSHIWAMPATQTEPTGGTPVQITSFPVGREVNDTYVAWLPDGSGFAFASDRPQTANPAEDKATDMNLFEMPFIVDANNIPQTEDPPPPVGTGTLTASVLYNSDPSDKYAEHQIAFNPNPNGAARFIFTQRSPWRGNRHYLYLVYRDPLILDPLKQAIEGTIQQGVVFVAAAGNEFNNNDGIYAGYPASFNLDGLISVAASTQGDSLAWFSNYGKDSVHIAAPGYNIFSTVPPQLFVNPFTGEASSWDWRSGTSMAAPFVAGAVALIKSIRPNLTPGEIKQLLMFTADPVAQLTGKVACNGRLNIHQALVQSNPNVAPNLMRIVVLSPEQGFTGRVGLPLILKVRVESGFGVITGATVTAQVHVGSAQANVPLNDNGIQPDRIANDGIYTATFIPTNFGDATIQFSAQNGQLAAQTTVTGRIMGVGGIDLLVRELHVPSPMRRGRPYIMQARIENRGTQMARAFDVGFFLSTDDSLSQNDTFLGMSRVYFMPAGMQRMVTTSVFLPRLAPTGNVYIIVVVDVYNSVSELDENNNTAAKDVRIQ